MIEQNQERVKLIKNGSLEVLHKEEKKAEDIKKILYHIIFDDIIQVQD